MKKALHILSIILSLTGHIPCLAQGHIYHGAPVIDITTFTFDDNDSLSHHFINPSGAVIDTSNTQLWQIGKTTKPFFSTGDTTKSIMTDTLNPYPINANDWFTLMIYSTDINPIVYFKHKYQTDSGHDGGIVEFSYDSGYTWQNALGDCHIDFPSGPGILTDTFYGKYDTLQSGEQAFSGNSNGWQTSGIQFFTAIPANKGTSSCFPPYYGLILLRFRFVSDSIADSLDGWIISSITVEQDQYSGKVNNVAREELGIFPNPVTDHNINFPALANENERYISICNSLGQTIIETSYKDRLKLPDCPPGVYFYKVTGANENYTGRIIIE